jgi:ribosomal protein S27AE
MTADRTVIARHRRICDRCGKSHTIETNEQVREAAGFIDWVSLATDSLFGKSTPLGRGPYDLCPACGLAFVAWWRGQLDEQAAAD